MQCSVVTLSQHKRVHDKLWWSYILPFRPFHIFMPRNKLMAFTPVYSKSRTMFSTFYSKEYLCSTFSPPEIVCESLFSGLKQNSTTKAKYLQLTFLWRRMYGMTWEKGEGSLIFFAVVFLLFCCTVLFCKAWAATTTTCRNKSMKTFFLQKIETPQL